MNHALDNESGYEAALRDRLAAELDPGVIGPAPVDAVLRRGKSLRTRRRTGWSAGLALILAAALALPPLAHELRSSPPRPAHSITVTTPTPHASRSEEMTGSVDGLPWTAVLAPQPGCDDGVECFGLKLAGASQGPLFAEQADVSANAEAPVSFSAGSVTGPAGQNLVTLAGSVVPGTTLLRLSLSDGEHLTVRPVAGSPDPAFALLLPTDVTIAWIEVIGADGTENAYAEPLTVGPDYLPEIGIWYRPGQVPDVPSRHAQVSGTLDGAAWSADLYTGAFGFAVVSSNVEVSGPAPTIGGYDMVAASGASDELARAAGGPYSFGYGLLGPAAVRVVVVLPGGNQIDGAVTRITDGTFAVVPYPQALSRSPAGTVIVYGTNNRVLSRQTLLQVMENQDCLPAPSPEPGACPTSPL